jgi:hypothetical protein
LVANSEILQTIAEIGAAFAGFAALVSAIAGRGHRGQAQDLTQLHVAVGGALMVVFAGIIPIVIAAYSLSENLVWRASAGSLLALNYAYTFAYLPWIRRVLGKRSWTVFGSALFSVLEVAFQVPLVVVVFGFAREHQSALYLTAVALLLAQGGALFLSLVTSVASPLADE